MKLWIDDLRPAPDGWRWVKTYESAISTIGEGNVIAVSLDHDLGTEKTGYDILKWIEERVATRRKFKAPMMEVHSANPVGRLNMEAAIKQINRLSKRMRK